jgi:hypothetical protein
MRFSLGFIFKKKKKKFNKIFIVSQEIVIPFFHFSISYFN